jgi:outer membrane protein
MINRRYVTLAIAATIMLAANAFAQAPATPTRPQTQPTQPATVNIPVSKVAVIFSAAFQDPKQGIARFPALLTKLNAEFQKTQDDLNTTAKTLNALQEEIKRLQAAASPDAKTIQAKLEQLDQMKKDYQRRGEDAQAAYQKRRVEVFGPLQEDVGKALDAFAKARGITIVLDASQVEGILFAAESLDITKAFIADYNQRNPATAAATTPR